MMDLECYEVDLNARCVCGCMEGNRFHKIYRFPNMKGASVASNPKIMGFSEIGYRVLSMAFDSDAEYRVERLPGFEAEISDCQDWSEVEALLERIMSL